MDSYRSYNRGYGRGTNMCGMQGCHQHKPVSGCNTCDMPKVCVYPKGSCDDDGCEEPNKHLAHFTLGIGYVPIQSWGELYDPCKALKEGTAFPCLNFIFCGSRGKM